MRIVDASGRPFAALHRGGIQSQWELRFGTETVSGLAAGEYRVEVTAVDGRSWRRRVALGPQAIRRLRF